MNLKDLPDLTAADLRNADLWWLPHMAESIRHDLLGEESGRGYVVRMGPAPKDLYWALEIKEEQ